MSRVDAQLKKVMKLLSIVPAGGAALAGADVDNFHFNCATVTTTVTTPTTTTVPGRRRLIG